MTRTQPVRTAPGHRMRSRLSTRNLGGVALFLFGTTYLWLTPAFAAPASDTSGAAWAVTLVLSLLTLAGFTVATWGLFHRNAWWVPVTLGSAGLGVLTLIPYWLAAAASAPNPGFDVLIHAVGCAGVFLLLLFPPLRAWVDAHVTSGR